MLINLCLIFLAGAMLLFSIAVLVRRLAWGMALAQTGAALAVLVVLTAVFDNIMIAAGLFDYGQQALLGWHVGLAPVEDFTYPAVTAFAVPGLYWLFGGPAGQTREQPDKGARP